jgi:RNA polymerase sigma-70 factor, ECF subfamily
MQFTATNVRPYVIRKGPQSEGCAALAQECQTDWSDVVARIERGDQAAEVELYRVFSRGLRFLILRQLGPDGLEDNIHECFLTTLEAIRRGQVREPARLMGFVRTIVQRKIAGQIEKKIEIRARLCSLDRPIYSRSFQTSENPEFAAVERQRLALARTELARLPERDREVLERFYVLDQAKEQICEDMGLSETQFRLIKSRTKAKLAARTQRLRIVVRTQVAVKRGLAS